MTWLMKPDMPELTVKEFMFEMLMFRIQCWIYNCFELMRIILNVIGSYLNWLYMSVVHLGFFVCLSF